MNAEMLLKAMQGTIVKPVLADAVPAWGTFYVKPQTVEEVDNANDVDNAEQKDPKAKKRRLARAACRVICDENGARILDPENEEHLAMVEKQPWEILSAVLEKANPTAAKK